MSMIGSTEPPAMAGTGLEPRDEHDLRIWTAIAMWLGGGCSIAAAAMVLGSRSQHFIALWGLVGFCALAATVTFLAFRPASNSALYVLTNIFSTLGALTVCLACLWSGGVRSGLVGMYLIPALYDAYFFRSRQALAHLVINSALVLSPLLYVSSLQGTQFPARATVLVLGMWGMSALVGLRKRNLLMAEMNARRGALSDPLTGLHNLRSLRERAARGEAREGTAVIEIDIDDFKAVNTAYGHTGADELLRAVGAGLLALTGEDDCVARIGGDEFVMLVNGRSPREIELLVAGCASAVRTASAVLAGEDATFTASVGCALWPWDGETFSELLAAADRRMYTAKGSQAHSTVEAGSGRVFGPPGLDPPVRADRDGPLEAPADGPLVAQDDRLGWARDVAGWWARRPANAIAGAVAWIGGAATTLVALLLPYSDTAHAGILAVLIVCAIAMAAFLLTLAPLIGRRAYLLADGLAAPGVVLGVYLTGGGSSAPCSRSCSSPSSSPPASRRRARPSPGSSPRCSYPRAPSSTPTPPHDSSSSCDSSRLSRRPACSWRSSSTAGVSLPGPRPMRGCSRRTTPSPALPTGAPSGES
jgi:diguanylate cyclase (GGDEF)-like protein